MQPGLCRHRLTRQNIRFAPRIGASNKVAYPIGFFTGGAHNPDNNPSTGTRPGCGRAGILIMDHAFSLTRGCGCATGFYAHRGATSVGRECPFDEPMSNSLAWNVICDVHPPKRFRPPCEVRIPDETEKA